MIQYFYQALTTPHGICLVTDNVDWAIQKLHKARRESPDAKALSCIVVTRSRDEPDTQVWLAKQEAPRAEDD